MASFNGRDFVGHGIAFIGKLCGERMMNAIYTAARDDASPTKCLASHARFD